VADSHVAMCGFGGGGRSQGMSICNVQVKAWADREAMAVCES
jgi:hypothetical protein